jgi:Na+/pantothenate symporter
VAQAGQGGTAALVTFATYTLVVFVLAALSHRMLANRKFISEYFLGSRGLGVIALTLSYGATSASAGTFAGFPALIYTHGWVLGLWIASYMMVPLCGMGLLGKRLNQVARKTGAITLPDVFRDRFASPNLGLLATVLIVFMLSFYLIPQFKIAAIILRTLLADVRLLHDASTTLAGWTEGIGWVSADPEYLVCLLMFAVLTIVYTAFGGFRAVVWTDVLQGFVMIFGVVTMLLLALWQVGGLRTASEKMAEMTPPKLGEVEFSRTARAESPEAIRVPADTWFTLQGEPGQPRLLLRTSETAIVPVETNGEEVYSESIKVVQITGEAERERILASMDNRLPSLPRGVRAVVISLRTYARGADQTGVYLTAPGPSRSQSFGFLPLGIAVSFFFYWALSNTGQPGNMVRLMAFDSSRTLKRAIASLTIYYGMIYLPLVVIFCCARVLVPGMDQDPDRIMPELAVTLAQNAGTPWLAGLLVAAPFAAAMSTVDSFTLIISSAVVRDMYQRNIHPEAAERTIRRLSYLCTLLIGVVVTLGAMNPPQFLQYLIVFTGGGLSVSFLMPVTLMIYWPRANVQGVAAAMLGGLGSYLSLYVAGFLLYESSQPYRLLSLDPLIWGFSASLVCGLAVSLASPPPSETLVRRFFYRKRELP